jgi:nitrite reductase/ring-hydroxylating ferredoxin subunit
MNDRRRFLKVITATATMSALGSACADDESGPTDGSSGGGSGSGAASSTSTGSTSSGTSTPGTRAGHSDGVSEDNVKFVQGEELLVGKDANGVYAMTSLCTHEQCDLVQEGSIGGGRIRCFCHDSEFDYNGRAVVAPASGQLQHYAVILSGTGIMYVQLDEPVSSDTRTPVA